MALLYGDNFQSYAVGATPPYGALVTYSGVLGSSIQADSAGLFGQTQSASFPSSEKLAFPNPVYDGSGPFYQQSTIYEYIKLNNYYDEQGEIISFNNAHIPGTFVDNLLGIRIMSDGTIAIVPHNVSAFSAAASVSDYSLLTKKWYLLRIDVTFGMNLTYLEILNCTVYINGVVITQINNIVTSLLVSSFIHPYWNTIFFSGAGSGIMCGGLWIYDTVQSSTFYPNPGVPIARLNQGVIELVKKKAASLGSNTRIYEA